MFRGGDSYKKIETTSHGWVISSLFIVQGCNDKNFNFNMVFDLLFVWSDLIVFFLYRKHSLLLCNTYWQYDQYKMHPSKWLRSEQDTLFQTLKKLWPIGFEIFDIAPLHNKKAANQSSINCFFNLFAWICPWNTVLYYAYCILYAIVISYKIFEHVYEYKYNFFWAMYMYGNAPFCSNFQLYTYRMVLRLVLYVLVYLFIYVSWTLFTLKSTLYQFKKQYVGAQMTIPN